MKLDGEVVTMVCDDVDSSAVCNAKLNKGKKRVKNQCPVSCEPFKKIKVGKKKNKETVLCGTMDTETMCEKKGVQKMCKNACGQCPTPTPAFIGLETNGIKRCNTQNAVNSGKCDTSVSTL